MVVNKDWQVVEKAHLHREHGGRLNFIQDCDTCNAIARLRERETQLERHDEAATQDAVFFRKRMVRLEEALREIAERHSISEENFASVIARRALAHEEKGS